MDGWMDGWDECMTEGCRKRVSAQVLKYMHPHMSEGSNKPSANGTNKQTKLGRMGASLNPTQQRNTSL